MALTSTFFVSSAGDRKYTAAQMAAALHTLCGNGFFTLQAATAMQASKVADTMNISIAAGSAHINGYTAINDTAATVTVPAAHATLPRIDRVVLRLDLSPSVRGFAFAVVAGTAASSPSAPALTRDATTYELGIATITVAAGATTLNASTLTDTRATANIGAVAYQLSPDATTTVAGYLSAADKTKLDSVTANAKQLEDDTSPVLAAELDTASYTIGGTEYDNGNSGTAKTIDWRKGNHQKVTMTGNCVFTFTAPTKPCMLSLKIVNDGSAGRTKTMPTIKKPGGTAFTFSSAANAIDILSLYYDGTSYYGQLSTAFA